METTLAGRSLASRIIRLRRAGYRFRLAFLWTPSAEFSRLRVAARVRAGGHDIPEATIRRRYRAGLRNFFDLYQPIADRWEVYSSLQTTAHLIAEGIMAGEVRICDSDLWHRMQEEARHD